MQPILCEARLKVGRQRSPATLETVAVAVHLQGVDTGWVRRSSSAPVSLSDPKTSVHSSKGMLVVTRMDPRP